MPYQFYAVRVGNVPGIYTVWAQCKAQIDGFQGAKYKGFNVLEEAQMFMSINGGPSTYQTPTAVFAAKQAQSVAGGVNPMDPAGLHVWTDGSHIKGFAGFGYAIVRDGALVSQSYGPMPPGPDGKATNNQAELGAAIMALQDPALLQAPELRVIIHSDSEYVVKSATSWITGWKAKGWRTASGAPVKNQDLMVALDSLNQPRYVFHHVYGHTGIAWNDYVDQLANAGRVMAEQAAQAAQPQYQQQGQYQPQYGAAQADVEEYVGPDDADEYAYPDE